jgi:hypothetical protein
MFLISRILFLGNHVFNGSSWKLQEDESIRISTQILLRHRRATFSDIPDPCADGGYVTFTTNIETKGGDVRLRDNFAAR